VEDTQRAPYLKALRWAFREKRLWPAALLAAVGLSGSWRVVFDWGPEWVGERAAGLVREGAGRGLADTVVLVLAALASFLALKAVGYLGETVLVRQVAGAGEARPAPFGEAWTRGRGRFPALAAVLLPWDAALLALINAASLIVILWDRWDPHLRFLFLYLLAYLAWFCVLAVAYIPLGIAATLGARGAVLEGWSPLDAWRRGWDMLRESPVPLLTVWLQSLSAELAFLVVAWPLSALLTWAAREAGEALRLAPLKWLVAAAVYLFLAAWLLAGQVVVRSFRSSLWTLAFLERRAAEPGAGPVPAGEGEGLEEVVADVLSGLQPPPPQP